MSLKIPQKLDEATEFARELADECMASSEDRAKVYTNAAQYYYQGSNTAQSCIHNKIRTFINKLGGYLYQPTSVRFNLVYNASEPADVLERAVTAGHMLTAEYRKSDADVSFGAAVIWSIISGCYFLKHRNDGFSFTLTPVHPVNMGVLSESTSSLDEQEAICHVSFPSLSQMHAMLLDANHPKTASIMAELEDSAHSDERGELEQTYFHQMVVGGLSPMGADVNNIPQAGGIVQVFPLPTPWRPQRRKFRTLRLCELWVKDRDRPKDWTTMQLIHGPGPGGGILIEGGPDRKNLFLPGHTPFVKVQPNATPGYFWGRTAVADVQMLQDMLNKLLRDVKVMWDRNAVAPYMFSGVSGITESIYDKLISEGGFISDPNPNAKASKLTEPPPPDFIEQLEFLMNFFDEAAGFTPVLAGKGEAGVRAGVHAQTLVRTSSPQLIDPAVRIERALASTGYLAMLQMANNDARKYQTDSGNIELVLPEFFDAYPDFSVVVDSHSASPAFAEDNRQIAIALAKAGALSAEDLIEQLHPSQEDVLIARLKQRQAQQQKMLQQHPELAQSQPQQGQRRH